MTFPIEMFKDDYYQLVRSPEEHKAMLEDGWVDKRPANHAYIPVSAKGTKTVLDAPHAPVIVEKTAPAPTPVPTTSAPPALPPPIGVKRSVPPSLPPLPAKPDKPESA